VGQEAEKSNRTGASQAPRTQQIIASDEENVGTESEGERQPQPVAAPAMRKPGRLKNASTSTISRQLLVVEKPNEVTTAATSTGTDNQAFFSALARISKQFATFQDQVLIEFAKLKAEHKAEQTILLTEIAALREDFSKSEANPLRTWATIASSSNGTTPPSSTWSSLPPSQQQSQNQTPPRSTGQVDIQAIANRERVVVLTVGRSTSRIQGKSVTNLKELAEKELQ
jgi:hypothetical protein